MPYIELLHCYRSLKLFYRSVIILSLESSISILTGPRLANFNLVLFEFSYTVLDNYAQLLAKLLERSCTKLLTNGTRGSDIEENIA